MLAMAVLEEINVSALCVASVLALVLCYQAVKLMLRLLSGPKERDRHIEPAITEEDYPELQIPAHPHLEVALEPTTGLKIGNTWEPFTFDNDYASGEFFVFYPPTVHGVDRWCEDYFKGKKRLWELRAHFKFKRPPRADENVYFAVELEDYVPLNPAAKRLQALCVKAFQSVAGGVYHSPGDDPQKVNGDLQRPTCALPLWAFDQFIVTPKGQAPPKLNDPDFPKYGQKRYQRVSEYMKEIEAMKQNFDTDSTYTFATWGVSRFLDIINWELVGIPMVTPIDFNKFAGKPPVHCVMYTLKPSSDDRHINSRKRYYFNAAVWSSLHRPEKQRFDALAGSSKVLEPLAEADSASEKTFWRRFKRRVLASFSCFPIMPQS